MSPCCPHKNLLSSAFVLCLLVALAGCGPEVIHAPVQPDEDAPEAGEEPPYFEDTGHRFIASGQALQDHLVLHGEEVHLGAIRTDLQYSHVALKFDASTTPDVWVRISKDDGASFGAWESAELTFVEEGAHNAFAPVGEGGTHLQLRFLGAAPQEFSFLKVEPFDATSADLAPGTAQFEVLADDEDADLRIAAFELAAHRAVDVTRAQWGARGHSCTLANNPGRVVVHHTATPTNDHVSVPARVRQVQDYSQLTKGFCDIKYHFLVGQDGLVYEGRGERMQGAHAGGANVGTIGLVFIGNYSQIHPSNAMLDAGARVLAALSEEHGIELVRQNIEGHRHSGTTPTACPGDALFSRIDEMIDRARQSGGGATTAQGCTQRQESDCAAFGCGCVNGECNGGFCPGSGCSAEEIYGCAAQGCGCVDGSCSGGACQGSGCTPRVETFCESYGCGCVDGACYDGFCGTVSPGAPARFQPVIPFRSNDTRTEAGGRVRAGTTRMFTLRQVPEDAKAVTANVTAVNPTTSGFLTVYPCGNRPTTSSLNYQAGEVRPSQLTVGLSPLQQVCVYSIADVDVVIDVAGYWRSSGGLEVDAYSPMRLIDTRSGDLAGRLGPGNTRELDFSGMVSPSTQAVSLNVTAIDPADHGYLTLYPCATGRQNTSNLNLRQGLTRANHVTVPLDGDNKVCIYSHQAATDLVIDLTGTWTAGGNQHFYGAAPRRVTDTRSGARPQANDSVQIHPQSAGVVFGTFVVVGAEQAGYAAVYSCEDGYRGASTLNFSSSSPVSNAVVIDASRGGICARVSTAAHLVFDTYGEQRAP